MNSQTEEARRAAVLDAQRTAALDALADTIGSELGHGRQGYFVKLYFADTPEGRHQSAAVYRVVDRAAQRGEDGVG